jgi:hypothetical protein
LSVVALIVCNYAVTSIQVGSVKSKNSSLLLLSISFIPVLHHYITIAGNEVFSNKPKQQTITDHDTFFCVPPMSLSYNFSMNSRIYAADVAFLKNLPIHEPECRSYFVLYGLFHSPSMPCTARTCQSWNKFLLSQEETVLCALVGSKFIGHWILSS